MVVLEKHTLLWRLLSGCLFAACLRPVVGWSAPLPPVSNLHFEDSYQDAGWIQGLITWDPPSNTTGVQYYAVLMFNSVADLLREPANTEPPNSTQEAASRLLHEAWYLQAADTGKFYVDVGTNSLMLKTLFGPMPRRGSVYVQPHHRRRYAWGHTRPPDRFLAVSCMDGTFQHGPPTVLHIYDSSTSLPVLPVSSLTFTDSDDRPGILQGTIEWEVPDEEDFTLATHYAVSLASDEAGTDESFIGEVTVESNMTSLPIVDISRGTRDFILVRARNPNGLSLTARTMILFDLRQTVPLPAEGVDSVTFNANGSAPVDELAGTVRWTPPADEAPLLSYGVFLVCAMIGCTTPPELVGEVPVGTYELEMSRSRSSIPMQSAIAVYAQNDKGLQTTLHAGQVVYLGP